MDLARTNHEEIRQGGSASSMPLDSQTDEKL